MSRRSKQQQATPLQPDESYWERFISHRFGDLEAVERAAERVAEKHPSTPSDEMRIFAERLIYALCPPEKGYAPVIVKTVKTIYDVLNGTKDFAEWFTEVKQALSLKNYQLATIIYQCLEGLRSREAREMRDQWYGYIQAELRGYGVI
jgi:hypothetical protein